MYAVYYILSSLAEFIVCIFNEEILILCVTVRILNVHVILAMKIVQFCIIC